MATYRMTSEENSKVKEFETNINHYLEKEGVLDFFTNELVEAMSTSSRKEPGMLLKSIVNHFGDTPSNFVEARTSFLEQKIEGLEKKIGELMTENERLKNLNQDPFHLQSPTPYNKLDSSDSGVSDQ